MPCRPFFCDHAADCADLRCPGHPVLHQEDGGHVFSGGIAFPIEPRDEPAVTPEQAERWTAYAHFALAALATVCAALAYLAFANH